MLPTLWFRNTWDWEPGSPKPELVLEGRHVSATHAELGSRTLTWSGAPEPLFCENETNLRRLYGVDRGSPYPKDGINDAVVAGAATVDPGEHGTKAALWYRLDVAAGGSAEIRVRLAPHAVEVLHPPLGGEAVVVPAHRIEDAPPPHALVARDRVGLHVPERGAHVQRTTHRGRRRVDGEDALARH